MKINLLLITLFLAYNSFSQEDELDIYTQALVDVEFVIIAESNDFTGLQKEAMIASKKLGIKYDKNQFAPDDEKSYPPCDSTCGCGMEHFYVARGRYDSGEYLSIELGKSYDLKEKYVLIAKSGGEKGDESTEFLKKCKSHYSDTKVIVHKVYMGCMH